MSFLIFHVFFVCGRKALYRLESNRPVLDTIDCLTSNRLIRLPGVWFSCSYFLLLNTPNSPLKPHIQDGAQFNNYSGEQKWVNPTPSLPCHTYFSPPFIIPGFTLFWWSLLQLELIYSWSNWGKSAKVKVLANGWFQSWGNRRWCWIVIYKLPVVSAWLPVTFPCIFSSSRCIYSAECGQC